MFHASITASRAASMSLSASLDPLQALEFLLRATSDAP
jgi:hypothetical protein